MPRAIRTRLAGPLAASAVTVMMAAASAPSPFYPILQERLALTPAAMTLVFAIYAGTLLIALLTVGGLSDFIGRRPATSAGFVLLAASILLFQHADSIGLLLLARAVQGLASGVLLSTLSATIADLEPADRPGSAAVVNAVAPMLGLALGSVLAGIALDAVADPLTAVFTPAVVVTALLAALVWVGPETSSPRPGWLASLRPRAAVPVAARSLFVLSVPAILAGWATGGLFLSLGASIVRGPLHVESHALQGLAIGVLAGAGGLAGFLLRHREARSIVLFGASALTVGTLLSLVALALESPAAYLGATVVVGAGFGTAFMGVVRSLAPLVGAHERAELFASLYVVAYLAFGVPAVLAGLVTPALGLQGTALVYGACVAALAAAAVLLRLRARV